MSNRGSRKGIGVERSDYDRITHALLIAGCAYSAEVRKPRRDYDPEFPFTGTRKTLYLAFETTTLVFDSKGRYMGRLHMSRDECDYFTPRNEPPEVGR